MLIGVVLALILLNIQARSGGVVLGSTGGWVAILATVGFFVSGVLLVQRPAPNASPTALSLRNWRAGAVLAATMTMLAGWVLVDALRFLHVAMSTTGTVIELEARTFDDMEVYAPVFEFRSQDGRVHRGTSGTGSSPPRLDVGDPIAVLYDPDVPSDVREDRATIWLVPIIFFFIVGLGTARCIEGWRDAKKALQRADQ